MSALKFRRMREYWKEIPMKKKHANAIVTGSTFFSVCIPQLRTPMFQFSGKKALEIAPGYLCFCRLRNRPRIAQELTPITSTVPFPGRTIRNLEHSTRANFPMYSTIWENPTGHGSPPIAKWPTRYLRIGLTLPQQEIPMARICLPGRSSRNPTRQP
jgi:hypothetical protein